MTITHNQLGLFIGVAMILTTSFIAYWFQKKLFSKYRNKVKNAMNKTSR